MTDENTPTTTDEDPTLAYRAVETLSPEEQARQARVKAAGERAKAEAAERRAKEQALNMPREVDGRGGLEPVRYGDWEIKGLTVDF